MKNRRKRKTKRKVHKIWLAVLVLTVAALILLGINLLLKQKHDASFSYQLRQGEKEAASGNYEDAIIYFNNALALNPDNLDARFDLAEIYREQQDTDDAETLYLEILEKDGENEEACKQLLDIYESRKEWRKIQELCSKAQSSEQKLLFEPYLVPEAEFSVPGGAYDQEVNLEMTADGAFEIYYTTDGSDPEESGQLYLGPIALDKDGIYTVRAVCRNSNDIYGITTVVSYSIDVAAPAAPVLTPASGNFASESTVYISAPADCRIYYTWDGTNPDNNSSRYQGALTIPEGNSILSVIAYNTENGKYSEVARGYYSYYPE